MAVGYWPFAISYWKSGQLKANSKFLSPIPPKNIVAFSPIIIQMEKGEEIIKCGKELRKNSQGPMKEKLAREILLLFKQILKDPDLDSDLYDEKMGEIHASVMWAYRELDMNAEALEAGENALDFEDTFEDAFTLEILSELLGISIKMYQKSDNRAQLNQAIKYGKQILSLDANHPLKSHIQNLASL